MCVQGTTSVERKILVLSGSVGPLIRGRERVELMVGL